MQWIFLIMVALAGFFGAGAFSMWRTDHRYAAIILAILAAVCLAVAIGYSFPGSEETPEPTTQP